VPIRYLDDQFRAFGLESVWFALAHSVVIEASV
jgi:hypothetical protein